MNILITGASGFIGSHLAEYLLKNNHNVINIDNFNDFYDYNIKIKNTLESTGHEPENFTGDKQTKIKYLAEKVNTKNYTLYPVDIRDLKDLEVIFKTHKIDAIVHLAAMAGVRPSIEDPLLYEAVNVKGTMNLLELSKKYTVSKFVCASSSSVYGNNKKVPFAETDVVDFAISPYAATKKSCEILGHVYHKLYNIDMAMLRFFTVYGPRQRPDLAIHKFTKIIEQNNELPFFGDGSTERDYTYIDDIIDGVVKSLFYVVENQKVYEIFNLGESETITLSRMVSTIESTMNKKANIKKMAKQPGDVDRTFADITKAKTMIQYQPKTKFNEGIQKFINWYKDSSF